MSGDSKDLFWDEKTLLEKAKKHSAGLADDETVFLKDYLELTEAYEKLLKQTNRLTRLSDKHQNRMNNLLERLSRYVSPPLYRKITTGKEKVEINKTKRTKLTIFFSDIKQFSEHSVNMAGEALSAILNSYLEEMTNIINKYNGTLDKYIGDAILVFFGDPDFTDDFDHARRCVSMAIEMRERMTELQSHWFDLGYPAPLHIRMGISTGYVSVGNFGSSERMDYTVIGSSVNLASRLQSYAAEDQILISHETWGYVKDIVHCSDVITLTDIKGFSVPILSYKVYDFKEKSREQNVIIEDKKRKVLIRYDKSKINKEELIEIIRSKD